VVSGRLGCLGARFVNFLSRSKCRASLDRVSRHARHLTPVIRTFRHAGLRELFETGRTARVRPDLQRRALTRLKVLDEAVVPGELNVPGFNFHRLQGKPVRYSLHVNGPWCVTFEWEDGDAVRVDLEQYH
jgi:toxin HigB-1